VQVIENMKGKRRKRGITIKIPLEELESQSPYEKIKNHLKKNPGYAYTRAGLMVELYNYEPEHLNKSFREWPEGASGQYTRIRNALVKLEKEGLVSSRKQGRRNLYWWKD